MNILFVCAGNTCRSPMAEALAKTFLGADVVASSAGVVATHGVGGANPHGLAVMQTHYALDTSGHVPRNVDQLDATAYDVVVTLDPSVTKRLLTRPTWQTANIHTWEIADPLGSDMATYVATAKQIEAALTLLAKTLE
ncbi:MAG: low molecular weight phosphatase family protein [Candidatus Promineifilaceae bacterium]